MDNVLYEVSLTPDIGMLIDIASPFVFMLAYHFIHMVDYEMHFRIAVEGSCQLISWTINFAILGGKNQSFR